MTDSKPDDALEESKALRKLLTNLAQNYYEGDEEISVEFTDRTAHAKPGPAVAVNVDAPWDFHDATGAHALRLLVDTLSHEVQHHNDSEIDGKEAFMKEHDDGYAKLAGMAINVLEDNHIDYNRHRKYRGLKKIHDWEVQNLMEDDEKRPPMGELEPRKQAVEGFIQLAFAGRIKGYEDLDPDVRDALEDVAPLAEQVKKQPDPARREEMAHEVVDRLKQVIPKTPDLPDFLEDLIEDLLEDLERNHFDPADAPDDENFDPDDAEELDSGAGEGESGEDGDGDGAAGEADESGEQDGEDGGAAGDGDGDAGGGDPDGDGRNRRVVELTGGREDADGIKIVK